MLRNILIMVLFSVVIKKQSDYIKVNNTNFVNITNRGYYLTKRGIPEKNDDFYRELYPQIIKEIEVCC